MIDPATVRIVIENLRNNGFTTTEEKLLGVVLAHIPQIQQCDIIEYLGLHATHCRSILDRFVEKKLVDTLGKRDIFYRPTGLLIAPTRADSAPTGTPDFPKTHNVKLTEPNVTNKDIARYVTPMRVKIAVMMSSCFLRNIQCCCVKQRLLQEYRLVVYYR